MFDLDKFRKTTFKPREEEMIFPDIESAGFSGKFRVRGLTAEEIARSEEASTKGKLLSDLVEKLAGSAGKEKASALLEGVGISTAVPATLAKRYEHVCAGVVDPALTISDAVKFGDVWPMEFNQLANKILELTGMGKVAEVKPQSSGS